MVAFPWLDNIPEALRLDQPPLADHENAREPWREAVRRYVPHDDLLDIPTEVDQSFPRGRKGRMLREWMQANQQALEYFDLGNQRPAWQDHSLATPETFWEQNEWIAGLRQIAYLRATKAKLHVRDNNFDAAVEALEGILEAARKLRTTGIVVQWLIISAFEGIAISGLRFILRERRCPDSIGNRIAATVDRLFHAPEGVVEVQRHELAYNLSALDVLPDEADHDRVVDAILEKHFSRMTFDDDARAFAQEDGRFERRDDDVRYLLKSHPRPYCRTETSNLIVQLAAHFVELSEQSWAKVSAWPRPEELKRLESLWPLQLSPMYPGDLIGDSAHATSQRAEIAACTDDVHGLSKRYPTRDDLSEARDRLRSIRNPLGLLLANTLVTFSGLSAIFRRRASLALLRLNVALWQYRRRHREWPQTLAQVVETGLLPEIPVDPFDGHPLRYCSKRRVIWSVGMDGIDQGGEEAEFCAQDIVHRLESPSVWAIWRRRVRDRWQRRRGR